MDQQGQQGNAAAKGLGDMVESGLASVGITKELFRSMLGRDCGCEQRQAALNRLGHDYLGIGPPPPPPAAPTG